METDKRPPALKRLTIKELEERAYAEIERIAQEYAVQHPSANTQSKKEEKDG